MAVGPESRQGRLGAGTMAMLMLALIPGALVILPTTVLVLVGMIPTIVAYFTDRNDDKSAPITVGAMNMCGVMPFAIKLWQSGHTLGIVTDLLRDPTTLMYMYGAAGVGWLVYYGVPPIVARILVARDEYRIKSLDADRQMLVEEWGPDVIYRPPDPVPTEAPEGVRPD